jgi:neutral ceramidase
MSSTLNAGVSRIDITPPAGFRMQGIMSRIEGARGIDSNLLATILVLADESSKVVLVDCDLIGFDMELVAEIRREIGAGVGTPATHVAVGCTHTHSGPCTSRGNLGGVHDVGGDPNERAALDFYITNLKGQLAAATVDADRQAVPARIGSGRSSAAVAINREELNDDGRVLVGRNPEGITDHNVEVLRVDDLEGNPIAVVTGYAAHPVVMGQQWQLISQDFPGVTRRVVEAATGATCLYFTGAAGNQASLSFLQHDSAEMERMGGQVGAAAAKAFFEIETRPHTVVREVGASLSALALYRKEFQRGPSHDLFRVAHRTVEVPLQPLPTAAAARAQFDEADKSLRLLESSGAPSAQVYPARMTQSWTKTVLERVEAGITQEHLSFEIVGYRIDDFVFAGMPGEPFAEIGLGVKALSANLVTVFAGYCNGVLAYWPSAETVKQGGMSVSSAVKTYHISAPPTADTVEIIVGEFAALYKELGAD